VAGLADGPAAEEHGALLVLVGSPIRLASGGESALNIEALDSGFEKFDRAVSLAKSQGAPFNYYDLLVERADALFFANGRGRGV
jgi:hypothetical protein